MRAVRCQTATSGINPAGSSRVMRLDPLSLPLSFHAHDTRADGGVRKSNSIASVSCCTVPSRACGWRSTFASATSRHRAARSRRRADAGAGASRSRAEHYLVCQLRPRGDRLRLADVERHPRAAAVGGRGPRRTGCPPPPPQRDPHPPPEISGAQTRRRFA